MATSLLTQQFKDFRDRLSPYQDNPLPSIASVTKNLASLSRRRQGLSLEIEDPFFDHEKVFNKNYIRAPLDEKFEQLGGLPNQHIYDLNPLAGTASDNISFLTDVNPLEASRTAAEEFAIQNFGLAWKNRATDLLNPNAARQVTGYEENEDAYDENNRLKDAKNQGTLVEDRNLAASQGLLALNDNRHNHPVYTHYPSEVPMPYILPDKEIVAIQRPEKDIMDDTFFDEANTLKVYKQVLGFQPSLANDAKAKGDDAEMLFVGGSTTIRQLDGERYAQEIAFKNKGFYVDVEDTPNDSLPMDMDLYNPAHQAVLDVNLQTRDLALLM